MFRWLKTIGLSAGQKSCRYNIRVKVKELVAVTARTEQNLLNSGGERNESDDREEYKAVKALLTDIGLGYSNGLSLQEIEATVIEPTLLEVQANARARTMVAVALKSAAEASGVQSPNEGIRPTIRFDANGNPSTKAEDITTKFLEGNVKYEESNYDTTLFRIIETNGLVSVRNDAHIRLVEDPMNIATWPYFRIIAPFATVELVEGEIPDAYLHEYPLKHYLTLRKHYSGE